MMFKRLAFFLLTIVFLQGQLATPASADQKPEVVIETSKGSFTIELYQDKAPLTVANFLTYVDEGFYDNTIFHRVIPDFVIQGGGFESGMKPRETRKPVKNESDNRLKNIRGSVAMARRSHPDTATSQFFVNLTHNSRLDYISKYQPGYTVFGKISRGMDVIDKISVVETTERGGGKDVPVEDVVILSAKRRQAAAPVRTADNKAGASRAVSKAGGGLPAAAETGATAGQGPGAFVAGEHYVMLERPVPTRDRNKVEVVELFSYGCPHCYEFEPLIRDWATRQGEDVDFWFLPAVWSRQMSLYARVFYAARELGVEEKIHLPLFRAIVVDQQQIANEGDLEQFFSQQGVDSKSFTDTFNSEIVRTAASHAEERIRLYKPAGAPEVIVNGRYRVDRMRAGGLREMLSVIDYLVEKERARPGS